MSSAYNEAMRAKLTVAIRTLDAALQAHMKKFEIYGVDAFDTDDTFNIRDTIGTRQGYNGKKVPLFTITNPNALTSEEQPRPMSTMGRPKSTAGRPKSRKESMVEMRQRRRSVAQPRSSVAPRPPALLASSPDGLTRNKVETTTVQVDGLSVLPKEQPAERITVQIKITFIKIGGIDTIHDRFQAEAIIRAKWREPQLDHFKRKADEIDWDDYWNPKLFLENIIGEPHESTQMSLLFDHHKHATVCETRRVGGTFFEYLELNEFPFDSQDLTITLTSERDIKEVKLLEEEEDKCEVHPESFSGEQEWHMHPCVNVWYKTNVKTVNRIERRFPAFSCAAKASRRPQFFIWNIIVVLGVISSMAFITFCVGVQAPQSRLQLAFILVLTTVTFKFVVNKSLPKISYLTYLDKYVLGTMMILTVVCVWHAIAGTILYTYAGNIVVGATEATVTTHPTTTTTSSTSFDPTKVSESTLYNVTYASYASYVTTTRTTTAGVAASCSSYASPAAPPKGSLAILIDRIVFGVLSSVYVGFHLMFVILVTCVKSCENEMEPNIDVDVENEDD